MGNDVELQELGAKLLESRQPRDTLVKLLKTLSSLLVQVDQSAPNDTHSAMNPCKEALVRTELLHHKDKEVRLLVATCASEIMRIEAPDIPYDDDVLKELFTLIVNTFRGLDDMDNPSFTKRVSILETVASIKSCVLMLDLDVGDLVLEMFRTFFARTREDHPPTVFKTMTEIMTLVIDESDDPEGNSTRTSGGIRDLLNELLQHLIPGKKVSAAAQKLAAEVILRTSKAQDQLVPYVRSLLSLVLESKAPQWLEGGYQELVFQLYQCNPDILVELSPDLLELLKCEDGKIRLTAIYLLGRIFSSPASAPRHNVAESCLQLAVEVGKRCADLSNEVRLAALDAVRTILLANPSLMSTKELLGGLDSRLLDLDPAVRIKAVSAICAVLQATLKSPPMNIIDNVALRLRDKKPAVRNAAVQKLTQVYASYCSQFPANWEDYKLECIPVKILKSYQELKPQGIERLFTESLFAPDLPMDERAKHWVLLFSLLENANKQPLERVLELKNRFQGEMRSYLLVSQKLKEAESPELEKKLQNHVKSMAMTFVDSNKVEEDIQKLHSVKDNNVFKSISTLLNVNTSYAEARATADDLLKVVAKSSQLDFYQMLVTRCSFLMFGKEHVKWVLKTLDELKSTGNKQMISACLSLLVLFAGPFPSLMEGIEEEILSLMKDGEEDIVKEGAVHILSKAGQCLRDKLADQKSSILLTLEKFCLEGTRNQAKYAVPAIVALSTDAGIKALSVLYGHLLDTLQSRRHLATVLQSLGCIAQIAMPVFETRETDMVKFILEDLLRKESPQDTVERSKLDWSSRSEECILKIYGLKALVKSCLPNRDAHLRKKERVKDVFPILLKLLQNGSISDEVKSSDVDKAYLRLASAKAVLRLARTWDKEIPPDVFHYTVMTALDPFLEVRQKFLSKTQQYLKSRHLPIKYATVFALCASDAVREVSNEAKRYMGEFVDRERFRQQPNDGLQHCPEYVLTYLVHVLGHHPSFPDTISADASSYEPYFRQLHLFLHALLDSEKKDDNVLPVVLQIFSTIKRAQDAVDASNSQKLYVLCDLGLQIARKIGKRTSDDAQTATVPLPTAFFKAGDANVKEGKDNYLPDCLTEEVLAKFHEVAKPAQSAGRKRGKKSGDDSSGDEAEDDNPPPKKARSEASDKKSQTKARAAKKATNLSEDDMEDAPPKRKRGRPSKEDQAKQKKVETKVETTAAEDSPAPKKRGRPKGASKKAKLDSPATSGEAKPETSTKQSGRKIAEREHRTPRQAEADKKASSDEEENTPKRRKKEKAEKPATSSKNGAEDKEGDALIGRKIAVWWPLDKKYYNGTIVSYNAKNDTHKVNYADGDKEVLTMSSEKFHFTDEPKQSPPNSEHGKSKKKSVKEDEPQGSSQKTKRSKKNRRESEDHHGSETKVNGSYKRAEEAESSPQPAASVAADSASEDETMESYRRRKRRPPAAGAAAAAAGGAAAAATTTSS